MSVLNAIFQAIARALAWILPISEYGHASLLNAFAGKTDGSVSTAAGAVHIGLAIGIAFAIYGIISKMFKEFFAAGRELVTKQLDLKNPSPARSFMYMTLLSFVPLILWCIPLGKGRVLFSVLHKTGFNGVIVDDAIMFLITGTMVLLTSMQMRSAKRKKVDFKLALIIGFAALFLVPVSGLSLVAGVFLILTLSGISRKTAFNYSMILSVPILFVTGVVELCTADVSSGVFAAFIGTLLAVVAGFTVARVFKFTVKKMLYKYYAYYDFAIGAVALIVGIVFLIKR